MDMVQNTQNGKPVMSRENAMRLLQKAKEAPRATRDQKTSLETADGSEIKIAKIGGDIKLGRKKIERYFYSTTPNVHGFFVGFREVQDKHGNTEMKNFCGRKRRTAVKTVIKRRYDAAKRKYDEREAKAA